MKTLILFFSIASAVFAQRAPTNVTYPSQSVMQQAAGSVTIALTAEQMTLVSKVKADICTVKPTGPGTSACLPNYATLSDFLLYVLFSDGGTLKHLSQTPLYAPESVKAAMADKQAKDKALDDATKKAFPIPAQAQ